MKRFFYRTRDLEFGYSQRLPRAIFGFDVFDRTRAGIMGFCNDRADAERIVDALNAWNDRVYSETLDVEPVADA